MNPKPEQHFRLYRKKKKRKKVQCKYDCATGAIAPSSWFSLALAARQPGGEGRRDAARKRSLTLV